MSLNVIGVFAHMTPPLMGMTGGIVFFIWFFTCLVRLYIAQHQTQLQFLPNKVILHLQE